MRSRRGEDPTWLVAKLLNRGEWTVAAISERTGLGLVATTQALADLEEAGLISSSRPLFGARKFWRR